ncbi:protein of unknown function [Rhodovastum atsumiense]|nr:protein of unknown function [Rhodovastum atsumiense]
MGEPQRRPGRLGGIAVALLVREEGEAQRNPPPVRAIHESGDAQESTADRMTHRPDADTAAAPEDDLLTQFLGGALRRAHAPQHHRKHARIALQRLQGGQVRQGNGAHHQTAGADDPGRVHERDRQRHALRWPCVIFRCSNVTGGAAPRSDHHSARFAGRSPGGFASWTSTKGHKALGSRSFSERQA